MWSDQSKIISMQVI